MKHVVVLGAGVIGLSCATKLLQEHAKNYTVTILASTFTPNTTSDGAGGIWGPYEAEPQHLITRWSSYTKDELLRLKDKGWPVSVAKVENVCPEGVYEPYWKNLLDNYKIEETLRAGCTTYSWNTPLITTFAYMRRLMDLLKDLGAKFVKYDITNINDLQSFTPKIDIIINCLGLNAKTLFNDKDVFPIRGVLVRLKPQPQIMNRAFEYESSTTITYVISREDKCLLGGTTDYNNYNTTASKQEIDTIIKQCCALVPELEANGPIMDHVIDTWVGLRPGRKFVRLELTTNSTIPIVHCYGHGGSGWTVHWGCAHDVVELVNKHFSLSKSSRL